jgi:large repetitive protein
VLPGLTPPIATEGQPFTNQTVFHFTDANPNATANQFTAVVTLGDGNSVTLTGTPSANGQIVADANGGFDVQLSYTYAEYLTNATFSVTVTDAGGASASASTSTFSVADAPVSATGTPVSATQGAALSNVQVGTLTDAAGTYSNPSDLSATINWGDSTPTSPATLVEVGTSGVYTVEGSHTYGGYGSFTISVSYLDAGGSTTTSTSTATVAGGPMTTASLAGTLGNNNWYVSAVNVTLSATDAASPIAHTYYSVDGGALKTYGGAFSVSAQGINTITYYGVDRAGNRESTESTSFNIDSVKPVTTDVLSGTLGANKWYTSPLTVTLNATDPNGANGSGVAQTFYQVDVGPLTTYTGVFTVSSQGNNTVSFYSVDNAGNIEKTQSDSFKIDTTAPTTFDTLKGTQGNNNWWVSAVKVTLTATDATSGVAATYYSLDGGPLTTYAGVFSVSAQGSHMLSFYSVDKAGNQGITSTISFMIDTVNPATASSLAGTLGTNGSYTTPVQVTLTASDPVSGVAQTYYEVDGGSLTLYAGTFTVSGNGKHTITFYSVDNAGNIEKTESDSFKIA